MSAAAFCPPQHRRVTRSRPAGAVLAAIVLGVVSVAGCESEPTQPDPTEVKVNDIDQRLGRVERVVSNQSLVELSQRIDALEAQMRQLRGSVEELQNGDEALRKQQRDLYADLDRRLKLLESGLKGTAGVPGGAGALAGEAGAANAVGAGVGAASPGSAAGSAPAGAGPVAGAEGAPGASGAAGANGDQAAYTRAFDALRAADYDGAATQFKDFLRLYPQSSLADNAEYWLGEAYYVKHDFDAAAMAFRAVIEHYPQSRKAPDALLKLGYTQFEQKHESEARDTLKQVVQRYPGSDAAKLAADRLAKLSANAP